MMMMMMIETQLKLKLQAVLNGPSHPHACRGMRYVQRLEWDSRRDHRAQRNNASPIRNSIPSDKNGLHVWGWHIWRKLKVFCCLVVQKSLESPEQMWSGFDLFWKKIEEKHKAWKWLKMWQINTIAHFLLALTHGSKRLFCRVYATARVPYFSIYRSHFFHGLAGPVTYTEVWLIYYNIYSNFTCSLFSNWKPQKGALG